MGRGGNFAEDSIELNSVCGDTSQDMVSRTDWSNYPRHSRRLNSDKAAEARCGCPGLGVQGVPETCC